MLLATIRKGERFVIALEKDGQVLDAAAAVVGLREIAPVTMKGLLAQGDEGLEALRRVMEMTPADAPWLLDAAKVEFGPAAPEPGKIICVGLNYRHHAAETGMEVPTEPVLFSKFSNTVTAHGAEIDVTGLEQVDYEAELAFVVGRHTRHVNATVALEHVLGYCNANDLSDRRLQFRSSQWLLGKTLDGFLPVGPWLRVPDDGFDPQNLEIRGWLNGELRQQSNTSDMIFPVAELLEYISRYMTLEAGDLVLTGTPYGVILGREDKDWMKPGDSYAVEITGLGRLSNRLVDVD